MYRKIAFFWEGMSPPRCEEVVARLPANGSNTGRKTNVGGVLATVYSVHSDHNDEPVWKLFVCVMW